MAKLSFRHMDKIYPNNVQAVFDFNLEIKDKEFIVFVGPSGCGKSTTLRMVAGLETISNGELYIDEKKVNDVDAMDRDIAMVFQNYALYPHMTVYNNMAFALKMRKAMLPTKDKKTGKVNDVLRHYTKKEIEEKVQEAARILDLTPYLKRKPKALSGGQRQRVALGRAIVRKPKVFLMDEPLSNLDAKLRVQTRTEIANLHKKIGATTIYVTHDQTEAMTMADRIVIMKLGFVQQIGSPKKVYENPINMFVAGFIGSPAMNFFDGNFDGKNFVFKGPSKHKAALNKEQITLLKNFKKRDIILGIRPEDIYLENDKAAENKSKPITLVCDASELLGHEIAIYSHIDEQKVVTKAPAKFAITAGGKNSYVFNQKHVHFFDKETGKCIDYTDENGKHPFTELSKLVKDPSDTIKIGAPVQEKKNKEEKAKEGFISRLKNKIAKKPKEAKPEPVKEPAKKPVKESTKK